MPVGCPPNGWRPSCFDSPERGNQTRHEGACFGLPKRANQTRTEGQTMGRPEFAFGGGSAAENWEIVVGRLLTVVGAF